MHDVLQAPSLRRIGKDTIGQSPTVNAARRVQDPDPEGLDDLVVTGPVRFLQRMSDPVGVHDGRSPCGKHGRNGGFSGGDTSGQADDQHALSAPRLAAKLFT